MTARPPPRGRTRRPGRPTGAAPTARRGPRPLDSRPRRPGRGAWAAPRDARALVLGSRWLSIMSCRLSGFRVASFSRKETGFMRASSKTLAVVMRPFHVSSALLNSPGQHGCPPAGGIVQVLASRAVKAPDLLEDQVQLGKRHLAQVVQKRPGQLGALPGFDAADQVGDGLLLPQPARARASSNSNRPWRGSLQAPAKWHDLCSLGCCWFFKKTSGRRRIKKRLFKYP